MNVCDLGTDFSLLESMQELSEEVLISFPSLCSQLCQLDASFWSNSFNATTIPLVAVRTSEGSK